MKRIFSILISLVVVLSAQADSDVIEIWTKAQLETLRSAVNEGTDYSGKTVKLMTDLDLGAWTPIGTTDDKAHSFNGTFDGQGYTINISVSSSATVLGLFGYFRGTVQHLKVTGSITNTNSATTSSTAGIAAYNRGTISQCANLATIIGTTAGGIAGENHGTITNCYNKGYIGGTSGASNYYLGGVVGQFKSTEISNVYASCTIDDKGTPGGIVSNSQSGTLSNVYYNVIADNNGSTSSLDGSTTLTGDALKSYFDNSLWTFADGELPELTCFLNKTVRVINDNDNGFILMENDGKTCTVELSNRILYKDGDWNTICLPFALSAAQIAGSPLAGATIMAFSSASFNTGEKFLTLNFSETTEIVAGTPYLIKWERGESISSPTFANVTINKTPSTVSMDNGNVTFVGIFSTQAIADDGSYLFLGSENRLYYPNISTYSVKSCRAYFHLSGSIKPDASRCVLVFDDTPTGIVGLNKGGKPAVTYDLQGRRASAKRGIRIAGGKKYIVK